MAAKIKFILGDWVMTISHYKTTCKLNIHVREFLGKYIKFDILIAYAFSMISLVQFQKLVKFWGKIIIYNRNYEFGIN